MRWVLGFTLILAVSSPSAATATEFNGNTMTALKSLTVSAENRGGYRRSLFKHWTDDDGDGCNTRYEVLIAEASTKPRVGASCRLTGGRWISAYDGVQTASTRSIDIDHMVPLAEAWDSGAWAWTPEQRMAFANDLGDSRSLIAVTASSNRQKSDQDPAEWLPSVGRCTYLVQWIAVKVRWRLSVDPVEKQALRRLISDCGIASLNVTFASVPKATATAASDRRLVPSGATQRGNTQQSAVSVTVHPGAFCGPRGAVGYSTKNVRYECKPSTTESRNRWRR